MLEGCIRILEGCIQKPKEFNLINKQNKKRKNKFFFRFTPSLIQKCTLRIIITTTATILMLISKCLRPSLMRVIKHMQQLHTSNNNSNTNKCNLVIFPNSIRTHPNKSTLNIHLTTTLNLGFLSLFNNTPNSLPSSLLVHSISLIL